MNRTLETIKPHEQLPWCHRRPRLLGLTVALPCVALLALSGWLRPDSRGYDTHTQLGLPPCSFMQRTGLPCPTCGMTTAFARMAHGQVLTAWHAQPCGVVLFLTLAAATIVSAGQSVTGRNLWMSFRPKAWWLYVLLSAVVAGWAFQLVTGLASGDLPVR